MLMRNDLCRLAIGFASQLTLVDAPRLSSSTLLVRSQFLASRLLTLALIVAGMAAPLTNLRAPAAASPANIDWPAYLGDKARSLYSPLRQINRSNVAQLKVAWTYDT